MQCDDKLLAELKYLVTKKHHWRKNNLRTNLAIDKENDIVVDGTWRKLKQGIFSNGVRVGCFGLEPHRAGHTLWSWHVTARLAAVG